MTKRKNCAIIFSVAIMQELRNAGVAEQADARDLKSRELIPRAGSIPVSGTKTTNLISRGRAARLARRAHNPEVRRFKSPPRNQKEQDTIWCPVLFRHGSVILCVLSEVTTRAPSGAVGTYSARGGILAMRSAKRRCAPCR